MPSSSEEPKTGIDRNLKEYQNYVRANSSTRTGQDRIYCTIGIDDRWWTIPAERSKNKKAHRVYLTNTVLELIGSLKVTDPKTGEVKDRGVIFPCPKKPKKNDTIKKERPMGRLSISQVVSRNLAFPVQVNGKPVFSKNGEPVTDNLLGVSDFTPHDLRRTAATFMSQIGFMD